MRRMCLSVYRRSLLANSVAFGAASWIFCMWICRCSCRSQKLPEVFAVGVDPLLVLLRSGQVGATAPQSQTKICVVLWFELLLKYMYKFWRNIFATRWIFTLQQIFWNRKNTHKIYYRILYEQKFEKNIRKVTKKIFISSCWGFSPTKPWDDVMPVFPL